MLRYTSDWPDQYRRAATYVDQILKGAKPEELPVQQPTKFQLMINLKRAKALGLTVPASLLAAPMRSSNETNLLPGLFPSPPSCYRLGAKSK